MIADKIKRVLNRIEKACYRVGRDPGSVRLMAVTKNVPDEMVKEAISVGVNFIGENQVQEARKKSETGVLQGATVAMIGHLQTNKVSMATRVFDQIHSVDSLKIASELSKYCLKYRDRPMNVLIQVNSGYDPAKFGVLPEGVLELVRQVQDLPGLSLQGFLTIAPLGGKEQAREAFRRLRQIRDDLLERGFSPTALKELSMGMSGDFEIGVEEGATIVRLGSALFGQRLLR
jgi:pyridoxal phosphate enzyme (YggS family)